VFVIMRVEIEFLFFDDVSVDPGLLISVLLSTLRSPSGSPGRRISLLNM